jgi:hypothetical protein
MFGNMKKAIYCLVGSIIFFLKPPFRTQQLRAAPCVIHPATREATVLGEFHVVLFTGTVFIGLRPAW